MLNLLLRERKKITIGTADILNNSNNFDAFYSAFLFELNAYNQKFKDPLSKTIPILKTPGFYHSKTGKAIAYFLLVLMIIVLILFFVSDKPFDNMGRFKLIFFEMLAGLYVWRSLLKRSTEHGS